MRVVLYQPSTYATTQCIAVSALSGGPGGKVLAMGFFDFQRMPVAFHGCVVVAVTGAAHRLSHRLVDELLAHLITGVLATAVGMKDEPRCLRRCSASCEAAPAVQRACAHRS